MASSSSSSHVAPTSSSHFAPASSSRSFKYDVFLSFRGEDTRKTFIDHLYSALEQRLIITYKDDEALPRGESIRPSLFKAIEESRIAIVVFSKHYADSSWCLEELAHIIKCKDERELIVMPVFYDVDPSEVRKQRGDFGKAFAQQEAENNSKGQIWRNALVDASNIAGWEPKHVANGHESKIIEEIVSTILQKLSPLNSGSFIWPDQTCHRLTLADIELATNNFDEALIIGRGGFGPVYKSLSNFNSSADKVAIKKLNSTSNQGANEFEAEVKILSTLRHDNLVPLIGYCIEGKEMVLAYEYMPNGTLEDHLRRGDTMISWLQRLQICIGAARGLDYLHTGTSTQHGVIHRDVKTSNILLDSYFAARISDFGLAKEAMITQTRTHVSTSVKGTFGYMDPSYFYSGKLTRKSDVYAFGVVLFEVLSGKRAVDPSLDEDEESLVVWAKDHYKKGRLSAIVDNRLIGQISKSCLKEFARLVKSLY